MARNTTFDPEREPFRSRSSLQLAESTVRGPFRFLNPTQARYHHLSGKPASSLDDSEKDDGPPSDAVAEDTSTSKVAYKWTSRNNRKGRHALVVKPSVAGGALIATPLPTNKPTEVLKTFGKTFTYYPVWDISWLVAYVFTWGSIIWVINAMFALLPLTNPASAFPGETLFGGGITAFIGATIFEFGSVLLMLEAINENRTGCFGWALEQVYEERFEQGTPRISPADCYHHHANKGNLLGKAMSATTNEKTAPTDGTPPGDRSWVWWPSWHEFTTHYIHDLGFLACSAQMFGASVFWISGFTALPGIFDVIETNVPVLNGVYWVPQVVGGSGFIVSGTLFMIETQKHWYQPAFSALGWHIGLWNLIGGIGFTLCPIFGFSTAKWRVLQASSSTFWELRNAIYELALIAPHDIDIITGNPPSLTQTCRQIRGETIGLYYGDNTFTFNLNGKGRHGLGGIKAWLCASSPAICIHIRTLRVRMAVTKGTKIMSSTPKDDLWSKLVQHMQASGCHPDVTFQVSCFSGSRFRYTDHFHQMLEYFKQFPDTPESHSAEYWLTRLECALVRHLECLSVQHLGRSRTLEDHVAAIGAWDLLGMSRRHAESLGQMMFGDCETWLAGLGSTNAERTTLNDQLGRMDAVRRVQKARSLAEKELLRTESACIRAENFSREAKTAMLEAERATHATVPQQCGPPLMGLEGTIEGC
ncbi:hypothetical protein LTS10_007218 [Elasticomyces elasticus]|nr:hypothetical protein LTS10_007218 [Elasticomyces elasticus]